MKINLAKSAGFCFGVQRALNIALKEAVSGKKICMLGDIVHNEEVVKLIRKAGIKKIPRLAQGRDKTLLIRAHGVPAATLEKAKKSGYCIIDATCPMVKEIHRAALHMEKKGLSIIIIGDKLHDEVTGIIGQLKNKALVIDSIENIPLAKISKIRQAGIVVQSTQNLEKVGEIAEALMRRIPKVEFLNTVCRPTRIKQEELRDMPGRNDCMVIIGSKSSANTKRLYEISKSLNQNTYWVSSKNEIKPAWFKGINSVGVTAGASTPKSTIQEIIRYLSSLQVD